MPKVARKVTKATALPVLEAMKMEPQACLPRVDARRRRFLRGGW